jgi:hypothetical protein
MRQAVSTIASYSKIGVLSDSLDILDNKKSKSLAME